MDNHPSFDARAQFPSHNEPRVWLITAGDSPIGLSVARQVLAHGDYAFLGLAHSALERDERRRDEFDAFLAEVEHHGDGWAKRMKTVPLDIRCATSRQPGQLWILILMTNCSLTQNDGRVPGCRGRCSCDIWKSRHTSMLHKSR